MTLPPTAPLFRPGDLVMYCQWLPGSGRDILIMDTVETATYLSQSVDGWSYTTIGSDRVFDAMYLTHVTDSTWPHKLNQYGM